MQMTQVAGLPVGKSSLPGAGAGKRTRRRRRRPGSPASGDGWSTPSGS